MSEDPPVKAVYVQPRSGDRGMNELHVAAYRGDAEAVLGAILGGISLDSRDNEGYTPLHWNADMGSAPGDREAIVDLLIEHGASIEARDSSDRTPLALAAYSGSPRVVQRLLEAGADANSRSKGGVTPLIYAAYSGSAESATLLLAAGAEANAFLPGGNTAYDVALDSGFDHVVEVLRTRCEN